MNLERLTFDAAANTRKRNLLKTSRFKRILNRVGPRKHFLNCFGCGDNLWWKEDVSIAFRKPEQEEFDWNGEEGFSLDHQNFYKVPHEDINFIVYKHGVVICRECFVKKSEKEFIEIFENVKKKWLKNKTNPQELERIRNYQLFLPIRTTKGTFKREMSATINASANSFLGARLLRKVFSLVPSYFTSNKF